jgi:transcription elongation factor GreB
MGMSKSETAETKPAFRNLITPEGLEALRSELKQLRAVERPKVVEVVSWAAGNGDRSENGDYIYGKKRLREIDRRIRWLVKQLDSAEVVDSAQQTRRDRVYFGATVTYAREDDSEVTVRIVGHTEADLDNGRISWVTPVGKALIGKQVGDLVVVRTPAGDETLEVVEITYP